MINRALPMLALAAVLASTNMTAHAQSKADQALLDALVRKGVLTDKEATDISAETAKEATSARRALLLARHGYKNVHPLKGGLAGWRQAGFVVEPLQVEVGKPVLSS